MTRATWTVLTCAIVVTSAVADEKSAETDREKIQGTWSLVSAERGGKPLVDQDVMKNVKLVFTTDKLTTHNKDRKTEAGYKLDPTKNPKEIDLDMNGTVGKGIYQLDGDTLKIAHGEVGDGRPKAFPAKEGSGLTVMVLKRDKAN